MPAVTVRWMDDDGSFHTGTLEDLREDLTSRWVWVDALEPDEAVLDSLAERFGLHPLHVEDVLHRQHRPKFDSFGDVVFIAWLTPVMPVDDGFAFVELDAFLGADFLITVRLISEPFVEAIVEDVVRLPLQGCDWVLHALLDRLVDAVLPSIEDLGDQLEVVEDALLDQPSPEDLVSLYRVRRHLMQLHRVVGPSRDILRGLVRERSMISEEVYRYFQDVGDHLARVDDSIETYRDVGAAAMDIYLSAQSNRMNEIMKQLTVVATIFMPLTLISGIYGMNVLRGMWPPVLASWSFPLIIASMVGISVAMAIYFRRRKWW